jgi:nicotinamide-nucleotide amidase
VDLNSVETDVHALAALLRARGEFLATAESCTGGLIAAACTAVAGSSEWFERGVVSYSNAAKTALLGLPETLIEAQGAVSEPVARAMAEGLLARCPAHWAVAVTGIAGPGGAVPGKPVGTVFIAWAHAGGSAAQRFQFDGDRCAVRQATVQEALSGLVQRLRALSP